MKKIYIYFMSVSIILGLIIFFSIIIPLFVITTPIISSTTEKINGKIDLNGSWGGVAVYKDLDANGKSLGWGQEIIVDFSATGYGIQLFLGDNLINSNPKVSSSSNFMNSGELLFKIPRRAVYYIIAGFGYWGIPPNYNIKDPPTYLGSPIQTTVDFTLTYIINDNEIIFYLFLVSYFLVLIVVPLIILVFKGKKFSSESINSNTCSICHMIREKNDLYCSNCGNKFN